MQSRNSSPRQSSCVHPAHASDRAPSAQRAPARPRLCVHRAHRAERRPYGPRLRAQREIVRDARAASDPRSVHRASANRALCPPPLRLSRAGPAPLRQSQRRGPPRPRCALLASRSMGRRCVSPGSARARLDSAPFGGGALHADRRERSPAFEMVAPSGIARARAVQRTRACPAHGARDSPRPPVCTPCDRAAA
ncbi:hypothetical protein B0H15DRAFT_61195 [Mycena belliarum]|uniref:Uncharacterized protein n=1 Tax=Mycena belliarum TaxID=1033014 RepID=A0AAD6TQM7_9AGAR|nr:hypothetical protein B0H15DRAFT_61195 [Mycena belliae]